MFACRVFNYCMIPCFHVNIALLFIAFSIFIYPKNFVITYPHFVLFCKYDLIHLSVVKVSFYFIVWYFILLCLIEILFQDVMCVIETDIEVSSQHPRRAVHLVSWPYISIIFKRIRKRKLNVNESQQSTVVY